MKIVTLYNHKGGVSKTTTTFNLASYLAEQGRNVLMVDADPQCNLTEIALSRTIARLDAKAQREGLDKAPNLPGSSVLDAINQRIKGDIAFIDVSRIATVKVASNLEILRGSVDLSSIEDDLAEAHVQRNSRRTNLMRTYVAIGDFLTRLSEERHFDYIFVDLGPSSGALTRAFFLATDYFYLPVAPDRFNVQAVSTVAKIVDRWMSEHEQIAADYEELGLPVKHGKPVFLGAVIQAFKVYGGKPKAGFSYWMKKIPDAIRTDLKPVLSQHSDSIRNLYLPVHRKAVAAEIPDFWQLAPIMQEAGKAVFALSQADTAHVTKTGKPWVGNNWTQAQERMASYKERFAELANILEIS